MRTSAQFAQVLRKGRRGSTSSLVVHALLRPEHQADPVIVGFVVGKTVGNSVTRHRVSRQLRAAISPRLAALEGYSGVVVRALPASSGRLTADLADDLDIALARLHGRGRRLAGAARSGGGA